MVFKNENHRQSGKIEITHYVSPHEFWFKYQSDKEKDHEIHDRIQRLGIASKNYQNHSPSLGDIVIVQCCFGAVNKYVRARVDYELQYSSGSEFILCAIDEGFPIRSSNKWITKLTSEDLKTDNSCVYKATLNRVVPATLATDDEEAKKMLKSMAEDCKNSSGATDNDVDEMCDKKQPTTKAGKCLLECMFRQFNCMNDNGEFQQNDFMDLMRMATEDNKTLTMAEEVSGECKDKKDANGDNCETAAMIMKCMEEGAKKRGFDHV